MTRDERIASADLKWNSWSARRSTAFTEDLKHDAGDGNRFNDDLRSLKEQGLVDERTVTRLREGAVADVVSVTGEGKALLDHHRDPEHSAGQVYYSGWVKPGEVWHDASLFRMVRQVEAELAQEGSRIQRVVLDDELKGAAYRAFHEARSEGEPDRYARLAVAHAQGLYVDGDRFVFPDVRLEVQDRDGTVRTVDLELVTKDYHRGHLSGKAGAGFRMFAAALVDRAAARHTIRTLSTGWSDDRPRGSMPGARDARLHAPAGAVSRAHRVCTVATFCAVST